MSSFWLFNQIFLRFGMSNIIVPFPLSYAALVGTTIFTLHSVIRNDTGGYPPKPGILFNSNTNWEQFLQDIEKLIPHNQRPLSKKWYFMSKDEQEAYFIKKNEFINKWKPIFNDDFIN